ncbi:hypothetical protein CTAYLR_009639 [Chrysophaeum taylorii]|uniref:Rieske domain-containing protein n=1 Tax=Chrysophaeum taylorii TaxID=2483200 RepID=A0AAD7U631_9STRA|nr:hypothetical protein CTAYLR_009639 [Chrysophaeum taylorii]
MIFLGLTLLLAKGSSALAARSDIPRRSCAAAAAFVATKAQGATVQATDRKGAPVVASQWESAHNNGRTDLVAGLDGEPYILLTDDTGKLTEYALRAECTHLGCLVGPWDSARNRFVCPCHGSEYDRTGKVLRGPAPQSLKLAKVEVDDNDFVSLSTWIEPDFRV